VGDCTTMCVYFIKPKKVHRKTFEGQLDSKKWKEHSIKFMTIPILAKMKIPLMANESHKGKKTRKF